MTRSRSGAKSDSATLPLWADTAAVAADAAALSTVTERNADPVAGAGAAGTSARADPKLPEGPEHWLALEFSERVVAWARAFGALAQTDALIARAAYETSLAVSSGHTCIHIAELASAEADAARMRDALIASGVVTAAETAEGAAPLVLDSDGRIYLHRYFDYERRLAARLARGRARVLDAATERRVASRLDELFALNARLLGDRVIDWQKLAVALAVVNRFTVISGGPGTGKTTTVVNLLACLIDLDADCRIALAAPTGKAAARMQDALRQRAAHLPAAIRERLPVESFTIHRLLGVKADGTGFVHGADNPIPYDVVVVDEASMLDLALAAKLIDAVPDSARVILLGDKDQLAAVESGAVFSELSSDPSLSAACAATLARMCGIAAQDIRPAGADMHSGWQDSVVWFSHNFRFGSDSGIGRLARGINAGDVQGTLEWLRSGGDSGVAWIEDAGRALEESTRTSLIEGYASYIAALQSNVRDRSGIFDAFDRYRILSAQRDGPRGVRALNDAMTRHCRTAIEATWPSPLRSAWYVGRPVMVLRNDYVQKLYNGDIGIALPDDEGHLLIHFRAPDGAFRAIAPMRLPEHETAFATTVHKAQGSEFEEVALVLPASESRVLTRELLYTAVTRARTRLTLAAGEDALGRAVESRTIRHSGLLARLRSHAPAG